MTTDFDSRELCPDGGCIGLIGADGRCKICGVVSRQRTTDPRVRAFRDSAPVETETDTESALAGDRALCPDGSCLGILGPNGACTTCGSVRPPPGPAVDPLDDLDFESRRLCPDEACIGLLGPNGRCKECDTPLLQAV